MPLILSAASVRQLLPMSDCIETLRDAHVAFSKGLAVMPVRLACSFRDAGLLAAMPAWLDDGPLLGLKSITRFPGSSEFGLSPISSTMLLLDPRTGRTRAIMDGGSLTEIRTAAASALATSVLARDDAEALALIGTGTQARSHLRAMREVRDVLRVRVAGRAPASAEAFVAQAREEHPELEFSALASPAQAARGADLICTVSSAREPLLSLSEVGPGVHINAVGSHEPTVREIAGDLMQAGRVVVDSCAASLSECGDCLLAIQEGLFGPEHVSDELGEVLAGVKDGRTDADQITIYQSCGIAIQDVAAAALVYERARQSGTGVEVELEEAHGVSA
jgi:ornithine cyclodeaminase/alanine dehydrogenase-like protein (mu-crystallin family)